LIASGTSDPVMRNTITAIRANAAPLSQRPSVQTALKQLPANRSAVMLVNVGEMGLTVRRVTEQMGLRVPLELPNDLPPVAVAISAVDQKAMRVDMNVPVPLLQHVVAAGSQFRGLLQGGPQRGRGPAN
jgi:hypothetical protein